MNLEHRTRTKPDEWLIVASRPKKKKKKRQKITKNFQIELSRGLYGKELWTSANCQRKTEAFQQIPIEGAKSGVTLPAPVNPTDDSSQADILNVTS